MKKFTTFETQLGESVVLTDKAKLSLYKKSQNSGISVDILEEVYRRGYNCWTESFGGNQDSFAFDRVNSFISGGFAYQLDEDLMEKRGLWDNIHAKRARIKAGSGEHMRKPGSKGAPTDAALKASQNEDADPCWKNYKQVGMKKKGNRMVPNCVPKEEAGLEEGKLKDAAKIAALMGALTSHAGKVYDVGNIAAHNDDPALAAATVASYANPASRALQMLPTALKVDKANKGENEFARQNKYPKKKVEENKLLQEPHSKNKNKSASRFDASDELISIYKHDTPGQTMKKESLEIIKRVVRECLEEGDVIKTKFATKNLQKRGIEGPHKIDADDFQRAWAYNKMPKSSEKHDYIAYHGTNARIMSDPSKGKHVDIKHGSQPSLIIDPDGSKTGKGRGIYAFGDPVKTSVVRKQAPKKSGNVVKIKETVAEATYQGKKVTLNKPMKGDVKKSKVFVDPDGDGKAQKVNFGDKNLSIKQHIPARKKSYCARSGGQGNLTDKTSANYWSRRAWNCEETEGKQ